ncbi:epoxide hydrolase family protein [Actinophytocola xanthii]|uniref:Epoxide hydrolase n=1 Tax=Actinophytocola xanthii TaxID=1912961 RepID=A0A1Q8C4F9_9PSEU|nr:epoxide hydrolase family protein [Actinophytocola xanthii]OLF09242.1 epoxide hydrolase [Actinophytocola xanthii]
MSELIPFRVEVPEAALTDLRGRLARTRWPEAETVDDWSQGVPLAYLRELCGYWADGYDWRVVESRLNALPQFHTELDGLTVHFVHVRSPHPGARPLVLTNGWPGSIVEYLDVIGPLTDPPDPADAFHVVCPTLPGFGFSGKPTRTGWGIERIARAWLELMARLGYDRFGAQGSDWGTSVSTSMAQQAPDRVAGIHLSPPLAAPDPATFDDLTDAEREALAALANAKEWEDGYSVEQSTKPQTIGYSLVDSPVGLAAWVVEKFQGWTDCAGHPENALTRDQILDSVMLYWLPGTGASSARLYWESIRAVHALFTEGTGDTVTVPTGCSLFPRENPRPSRRWAARRFPNILHWNDLDRGGHFAAFEQPDLFVDEVRAFFRLVQV